MDVILLERVAKLGQMGEVVKVRDGYARNYLLPQGKALRANAANKARFEAERETHEHRNKERMTDAQSVADQLNGQSFTVIRSAGETGQLYGSVASRDVVLILEKEGIKVERKQVDLNVPIKTIGIHNINLILHADVQASVEFNIARTPDEAERQAKGQDMTSADAIYLAEEAEAREAAAAAKAAAEAEALENAENSDEKNEGDEDAE